MLGLSFGPAHAVEEGSNEKKPGMFSRVLKVFRGSPKGGDRTRADWKNLALTMSLDPAQVKLGENRQVKVALRLSNKGKKLVQLEFPTTQRIEVLVRRQDGKLLEQWSEDQAFSNEPTLVTINPGERLEYTVSVSTRDMEPGQRYTIEGFFPNFEPLKTSKSVTPEK